MGSVYDGLDVEHKEAKVATKCSYVSPAGTTCSRYALEGETLCVMHGAPIERSKEYLQRKLLALQERSIAVLAEELAEAYDSKARQAVAFGVLDRTGLGPHSTVSIERQPTDFSQLSNAELITEFEQLTAMARELEQRRITQRMNESPVPSTSERTH